ncbi:MAG: hypothetical protein JO022_11135 [Acidobacteriaceae bacterium]|nr:hypothetical protein [Acidobacteriaceae bacterium]
MAKEQVRDYLSTAPGLQYFADRMAAGWRLVAVSWERDIPGDQDGTVEEPPYGLQVSSDCLLLQENAMEKLALIKMMQLIVKDVPLDQVAAQLNASGYRTRHGAEWTPGSIFDMLPRLIEAGPKILVDKEYVARKHN